MLVKDVMDKINEVEEQTKFIRAKIPTTVHSDDEITITYSALIALLEDWQELIDIYKRLDVNYK